EWVIVSPWDGEFPLPSQSNEVFSVRVARKKDFEVLLSSTGPQVILNGLIETVRPFLQKYAEENQIDSDLVSSFIDTLAEKSGFIYERGLASLASRRPKPEAFVPVEKEQLAQTFYRRGEELHLRQKYDDAVENFRVAACLLPSDPDLLELLGQAL